jgi:hypothetical protein
VGEYRGDPVGVRRESRADFWRWVGRHDSLLSPAWPGAGKRIVHGLAQRGAKGDTSASYEEGEESGKCHPGLW